MISASTLRTLCRRLRPTKTSWWCSVRTRRAGIDATSGEGAHAATSDGERQEDVVQGRSAAAPRTCPGQPSRQLGQGRRTEAGVPSTGALGEQRVSSADAQLQHFLADPRFELVRACPRRRSGRRSIKATRSAELVGLLQVLGGQQDRHPVAGELGDDLPTGSAGSGVEAGGRLVEEDHRRRADQAESEVEPASHAAGVASDPSARRVGELELRPAARLRRVGRRRAGRDR